MLEKFECLIGKEMDIIQLSNELYTIENKVDDICDFGNWEEILESGSVIVAIDECGEEHIQIYFDVIFTAGEDERIEATIIKITNIEKF